jgi:pimeloyl-ACP methyl ester carboxylesterase
MPLVLVHGVPDTPHLWDRLRRELSRSDVVAPSLPGFGCPLPPGFPATKEAYADWLLAEIERIGEPVDVVGHDWGSLLVQRVVSLRQDLFRSWAVGSGPVDAEYVWHENAQLWQTPGVGETFMQTVFTPEALAPGLVGLGVPQADAETTAARIDDTMKDCLLRLYRSAVTVGAEWQPAVDRVTRPHLGLWGEDDPFVSPEFGERLAARVGGECVRLAGCGHWWPVVRPAEVARLLEAFWARL